MNSRYQALNFFNCLLHVMSHTYKTGFLVYCYFLSPRNYLYLSYLKNTSGGTIFESVKYTLNLVFNIFLSLYW